jgi:hypothetical protein
MSPLDILRIIVDVVKAGYQAARRIPQVTCDVKGLYKARWSPDFFPDENGSIIAEGIRIETAGTILLANSGSVDTTVKGVQVVCMSGKKILGQLECSVKSKKGGYAPPLSGVILLPRRIWGPETIRIEGSLWGIDEPPKDLEAKLVIEVVSQRPIKKKIKLYL